MIDLERYNSLSPYSATWNARNGFYEFTTDYGVHYSVGFIREDIALQRHEVYQFVIANTNHRPSPRDEKVRQAIVLMIDEFFRQNNTTMLYICETTDGKQAMRHRLFQHWFSRENQTGNYSYHTATITDEEGIINYATIITRNDHPELVDVIQDFIETVQLLNGKQSNN